MLRKTSHYLSAALLASAGALASADGPGFTIALQSNANGYLKAQPKHPADASRPGARPQRAPTTTEPSVADEILKALTPGEALREPPAGGVIAPANAGEIVTPAQAGQRTDSR